MEHARQLIRRRMQELGFSQKQLACRWHEAATGRGAQFAVGTVISQLNRLLRGDPRGGRFFFSRDRVGFTAAAVDWTIERFAEAVIFSRGLEITSPAGGEA